MPDWLTDPRTKAAGAVVALLVTAGVAVAWWKSPPPRPGSNDQLSTPAGQFTALASSPDGLRLVAGTAGGQLFAWESRTRKPIPLKLPELGGKAIGRIALSSDGWLVVSSGPQLAAAHLLEGIGGRIPPAPERVTALQFRPRRHELVAGLRNGKLLFINVRTAEIEELDSEHDGAVKALLFTWDGARLITAGADGKLIVRDAATRAVRIALTAHAGDVAGIALSPDGKRLLSAGWDGMAKIWNLENYASLKNLELDDSASAVGWMGDCPVVACWDGRIRVWGRDGSKRPALDAGEAVSVLLVNSRANLFVCGGQRPALQFWPWDEGP